MQGSWVGTVLFIAFWGYSNLSCIKYCIKENLFPKNCVAYIGGCNGNFGDIILLIILILIGFLIGWAIHSLIRSFRK